MRTTITLTDDQVHLIETALEELTEKLSSWGPSTSESTRTVLNEIRDLREHLTLAEYETL